MPEVAMIPSDSQLVRRCAMGDQEAFGTLYDRHAPHVYRFLCRLCGQAADADDLLQETFITSYQRLGEWRGEGKLSTWLCGIAFRRYQESRRRQAVRDCEPLEDGLPASLDSCPWARLDRALLASRLEAAVDDLPDHWREAVVLVKIEGLSYREAAEWLKVPVGTLQSRLWRGVQRLQIALQDLAADFSCAPVIAAPEPDPVSVSTLPTKEIL